MSLAEVAETSALPPANESSSGLPDRPRLRLRRVRPRDDLRVSIGDGACVSAMVGLGETYFAAFALALGVSQTVAGLVATLPMLAGATLQLATPWFLQRVRSFKKWVVLFATLQATALLCMPLAVALAGSPAAAWIFFAASVYFAASQATGPAWNTWIEEIVPRSIRARFFAARTRVCQFATLVGFVIGGLALHAGKTSGHLLLAFVAVFLLGAACRFTSARFLSHQSEPSRGRYQLRQVPIMSLFQSTSKGAGAPLVVYLLAMQTAVQISGPYFAPFMLAHQKMSYLSFMLLIGVAYFGKVVALPLWGRVAHTGGARRLLSIGGTAIIPVAAFWIGADFFAPWHGQITIPGLPNVSLPFSAVFLYLSAAQFTSGFVWAAYELAMQLMFLEAIPRRDRPCMLTYYNFGNSAAQVAGGLIGATILQFGAETHTAYLVLFGFSSLMRLCTMPLLARTLARADQPVEPVVPAIAA
jgi:MFS family permease